jgi:hypothetical protein
MTERPAGPGWWMAPDGRWYLPQEQPEEGGEQVVVVVEDALLVPEPPPDEMEPAPERRDVPAGFGCVVLLLGFALVVAGAVLVAALVMALVGAARGEIDDVRADQDRQHADARDDAGAPACSRNEYDDLHAEVLVTNDSSKPSRYAVEVEFLAADGEHLDSSYDTVTRVAPGQSATVVIDTLTQAPEGPFTCHVEQVDRWADEG